MIIRKITNVGIHSDKGHDYKVVVDYRPTWLGKLFGLGPHQRVFVGSSTVWHELPRFSRAGTGWESYLSDIYMKHKYENECE